MNAKNLKAEKRSISGRKVKTLRAQGILPANIFGKKVDSLAIQIPVKDFEAVYKETGETGLINLQVDNEERPVLVHNLQVNAKTDEFLHADFLQVNLKEKVEAKVPVELVGESPAEKQSLGTVVQHVNELTVEALPGDLPEKFEIDTSELSEVDQSIHIKDIKVDRQKIEIKDDPDAIVAKVEPPQKEEEIIAPVAVEGEAAEGAAPAEGEDASAEPKAEESKSEN